MTKILTLVLVFLFSVVDAKTPVGFKKWRLDNDTTFAKQIGGAVRNYQNPENTWAAIENGFEIEGDSVVYVEKSVLRARVNKNNGVSKVMLTWEDQEYTVTQRLLGVVWIKISTRQSQWIDSTMSWDNFSVDSNICKWTGISPGVDYRVLKDNGRVAHGIFYKPAFLDSAVVLYNQRPDSLDIALANVMVYTLSANIDNHDSAMGELSWRRLKDFGYYSFNLRDQRLHFPGSDTLPSIPVKQYWERRGTKIVCVEYVMMRRVKQVHEVYPSATIWHNDTKKIEGTTNVEDTYIYSDNPNGNYGGSPSLQVKLTEYSTLIRVQNVASELGAGATISACVCSAYVHYMLGGGGNADAFVVFKPWLEGTQTGTVCADPGCSYNDWSCTDNEWTTEGCLCARDGGVDNSYDDGACNQDVRADRKATAEDTEGVTVNATWYGWSVSSTIAQAWYAGTKNEEGIFLEGDGGLCRFYSTEAADSRKPFWVFTYTTAAAGGTIMRTIIR